MEVQTKAKHVLSVAAFQMLLVVGVFAMNIAMYVKQGTVLTLTTTIISFGIGGLVVSFGITGAKRVRLVAFGRALPRSLTRFVSATPPSWART